MTKVPADVFDSLVLPLKQEIANCIGVPVLEAANRLFHVFDRLERAEEERPCAESTICERQTPEGLPAREIHVATLRNLRAELQRHLDTLISSVPKAHSVYQMGRISGRIQAIEEMIVDIGRDIGRDIEGMPQ